MLYCLCLSAETSLNLIWLYEEATASGKLAARSSFRQVDYKGAIHSLCHKHLTLNAQAPNRGSARIRRRDLAALKSGHDHVDGNDDGTSTSRHLRRAHHVSVPLYTPDTVSLSTQNCSTKYQLRLREAYESSRFTRPNRARRELELWQGALLEMPPRKEAVTGCHCASDFPYFHLGTFLRLSSVGLACFGENLHQPPKRLKILGCELSWPLKGQWDT